MVVRRVRGWGRLPPGPWCLIPRHGIFLFPPVCKDGCQQLVLCFSHSLFYRILEAVGCSHFTDAGFQALANVSRSLLAPRPRSLASSLIHLANICYYIDYLPVYLATYTTCLIACLCTSVGYTTIKPASPAMRQFHTLIVA